MIYLIGVTNLIIMGILIFNLPYIQDSHKLNAKVFRLLLLDAMLLVLLDLGLRWSTQFSEPTLTHMIRLIYYILIPSYVTLSAYFALTWAHGIETFNQRHLWLLIPLGLNVINILLWSLSSIRFEPSMILNSPYGLFFVYTSFLPLGVTLFRLVWYFRKINLTYAYEIIVFSIPVTTAGILQVIYPDIPLFWNGSMISFVLIYFSLHHNHSMIDTLTQCGNRRKLNLKFQRLINSQSENLLGFILIDCDNFKSINDTHGHLIGDHVLIDVARVLQRSVYSNDEVFRLGGDEFTIILDAKTQLDSSKCVHRIKSNLHYLNSTQKYPFKIELSIGYHTFDSLTLPSLSQCIEVVDKKMYDDKRQKKGLL